MTDSSLLQPKQLAGITPEPALLVPTLSGGVDVKADQVTIGGDVVGRDKIVQGFTADEVDALLTHITSTFQPKPFTGRCPYVGLRSFDESNADLFFGRETLIHELAARLQSTRVVFITGPSGSGKSSLVRAGLFHDLKQGALPGSEHWLYESLRPGRDPLSELARVAASLAGTLTAGEDIRTKGLTDSTIWSQWIEIALKDHRERRAVILVDQFEETFTQVDGEPERAAFLNLLTYAAAREDSRVTIVFAMRSDFISDCAAYPALNDLLNRHFWQVGAMTPPELVNAIAQPALQVGLRVEPELVAQIITDMKGEPGALPLVQFALHDLFDARQAGGGVNALTLKDYLERGGIHRALERHADAAFGALTETEQSIAREIFSGLIQSERGAPDTRRMALVDELVPAGVDISAVQIVVAKLADARLIITDEHAGRDSVTLAHEKLIDAWPWLRKLVDENHEAIEFKRRLIEDAREWDDHQHDLSYLYSGARLLTTLEQLAARRLTLSQFALDFVAASQHAQADAQRREQEQQQRELADARRIARAERRAKQNLRLLVAGLSALLLIAGWLLIAQPLVLRWQARGETVLVPAGEFTLGSNVEVNLPQERAATWRAPLKEFRIEKYEVTNAQYRLCVQDRACSEPSKLARYEGDSQADLPVVAITLRQAADYCEWIGRRVPTEIEWEWAARGAENWKYPTGDEDPAPEAINAGTYDATAPASEDFRQPVNAVVKDQGGTFGMAGNVQEWTVSFFLGYDDPAYRSVQWQKTLPITGYPARQVVARGGSYIERIERARSIARHPIQPDHADDVVGLRCVEGGF